MDKHFVEDKVLIYDPCVGKSSNLMDKHVVGYKALSYGPCIGKSNRPYGQACAGDKVLSYDPCVGKSSNFMDKHVLGIKCFTNTMSSSVILARDCSCHSSL